MKTSLSVAVPLTAALLLGGCHAKQGSDLDRAKPDASEQLRRTLEIERQSRLMAEERATQQERAKSRWQTAALLSVAGAIILLVVGVILGTRAKYDSERQA